MIKVSVLYPRQDGAKFDMTYYLDNHIPLVKQRLGGALKTITVEQGLAGGAPQSPPPFAVMAQLSFDSVDAFQSAFGRTRPRSWATSRISRRSSRRCRSAK